ncbi:MAG TPA: serine protease [Solirubrobacterales bacterium]|nr:serine protease [Solirubrobacterales bacterium]
MTNNLQAVRVRGEARKQTAVVLALVALAVLALPAAASAEATAKASIVGGRSATIAEFPSLAFIEAREGKQGFACTGTVVAPRVVLTAAHCVESIEHGILTDAGSYALATGVTKPSEAAAENIFRVTEAHVFPGFDPGALRGDAGILILDRPTTAPPIALAGPDDAALFVGGATVQLAGWGLTRANAENEPEGLRATQMLIRSANDCRRRTRSYYPSFSPAAQTCALDLPGKTSGGCFGDSGGPAIGQRPDGTPVELGVISTGGNFCSTKLPNVFTRTDYISGWVSEWIAATESGGPRPVVDPKTPFPLMTKPVAETFAVFSLNDAFGSRFERAKKIAGNCRRVSRSRFKCEIAWLVGPYVYAGVVSPFYVRHEDAVLWDSHFRFRWGVVRCLRKHEQGGPRCPIQSKRG